VEKCQKTTDRGGGIFFDSHCTQTYSMPPVSVSINSNSMYVSK